jgi:hypothetical protein
VVGKLSGCPRAAESRSELLPLCQSGGYLGILEDELFGGLVNLGGTAKRGGISNTQVMQCLLNGTRHADGTLPLSVLRTGLRPDGMS